MVARKILAHLGLPTPLFAGKTVSKIFGLYPVIGAFRRERQERWHYTLMMSTGLTFGTISALFGLSPSPLSFRPIDGV